MELMEYDTGEKSLDVKNYDRMFSDQTNATWSRDIPTYTDARLLKSIYFTEDWVYIPVDKIAMNLAGVPLRVFKESVVDGETMSEPADYHPVQYVLDNPNQFQTAYALQYASITDFCVTGNVILYNAMINRNLIHIPTENINMDIDGNGNLRSYSVIGFDTHSMPFNNLRTKLDPRNIIHIKRPNASSIHWGMSPLVPGQSPVLFNRYSSEYLNGFYKRGAQPGMIVTTPETASDAQRDKLKLSLEKHNAGRQNQRNFMVLPGGAKAETFAHTIADQQLLEHIKHNRETIINMFGVPKEVLSIQDTGSGLGSDQYKQAMKSFWTGTLMNIGNMFAEAYNKAYQSHLGQGYKIRRDYSQVPELQEDLKVKSDLANSMLTTMTLNEIRKKIWKLDPIEGGDKIASMNPQQAMNPYQSYQSYAPQNKPYQDQPANNEEKQQEQPTEKLDYKSENLVNFGKFIRAEGKSWWDKQEVSTMGETQEKEDPIRSLFMEMIVEQVATASNIAKDLLVTKAVSIADEEELDKKIRNAFQKQRADWVKKYESTLNAQVDLGYDSILNMPFGKPDSEAITVMKDEGYKSRRKELFKRAETSFDYLSDTTIKKVFNTIKAGIEGNKSISDIGTDIRDVAKVSLGRADTIARTEVLTATSIGQKAAMEDAGKVLPDLYKVWINANDERVRGNPGGIYPDSKGDHWSIAGEAIPYKEKFANGLDYPREGGGAAHEVINCRCSLIAVDKQDLERLGIRKIRG